MAPAVAFLGDTLVGGFTMHPEAVDAGILGVAPVGQNPQLHHLVAGHLGVLVEKERREGELVAWMDRRKMTPSETLPGVSPETG